MYPNLPKTTPTTYKDVSVKYKSSDGRLHRLLTFIPKSLIASSILLSLLQPVASAYSPFQALKPPEGVTVRSVDGVAVVSFRRVTGKIIPNRYEVSVDGYGFIGVVSRDTRPMGVFHGLKIGQQYTAKVTAVYDGYPSQTSALTFVAQPIPSFPSVKFTHGLGSISFIVNAKEVTQPAPLHGWIIRLNGVEVFTKSGRGIFTGLGNNTTCFQYEMWALYDLGQMSDNKPLYHKSERILGSEILCPLKYSSPTRIWVTEHRISDGYFYATFARDSRHYVDVVTFTINGKNFRYRTTSYTSSYPFKIKLWDRFSCRDRFVVTFSNRLGEMSISDAIGYMPELDEDPVTCLAPGQTKIRNVMVLPSLNG